MSLDDSRQRWLKERQQYEAYGQAIVGRMRAGVRSLGLWCDVSARAKEPHSLIKKLLKGKHTYESLSDKVGARCIIRYRDDLRRVVEVAQRLFLCGEVDYKSDALGVAGIGYLSIHVDVELRPDDPLAADYGGLRGELQIRTLAQHLWSEISHDAVYKNDVAFAQLPDDLIRRVNLMAGLIEVADREFDRLNGELVQRPEVLIYKTLERQFFKLTAHVPDPELSLDVISLLLPMYGDVSPAMVVNRIDVYVDSHQTILQDIYAQQQAYTTSELVFQPEALMVAELLEHEEVHLSLRRRWSERFPEAELERLATAMGHSFD